MSDLLEILGLGKLPFEVHLFRNNFIGPGTRLDGMLKEDRTPRRWRKPMNRVDNVNVAYQNYFYYTHTR